MYQMPCLLDRSLPFILEVNSGVDPCGTAFLAEPLSKEEKVSINRGHKGRNVRSEEHMLPFI